MAALDLRMCVEEMGYTVVGTAASSAEALHKAEIESPDLVLMDICLEGEIDGIQTATALRKRRDIPVVFLTANADAPTVDRVLLTSPEGYLTKPFDFQEVRSAIEIALRQHAQKQEAIRLRKEAAELTALAERLRAEASVDPLTQLFNRRHLDTVMRRECGEAERTGAEFSLILLDLDHFKQLNDTFGHAAGDLALQRVAACMRNGLRSYDSAFRYGGEELLVVVPGAGLTIAERIAEDLRANIAALRIEHEGRVLSAITASFGVATYPTHGTATSALLEAADAALYAAKEAGRNRVSTATPDSLPSDVCILTG